MKRPVIIGVIGASEATEFGYQTAREVGRLIAGRKAALVCGGLGGVMEAACRGCTEAGGMSIGILPGASADAANPWVTVPVVSNMGHARNVMIAHTAQALIAVEGEFGTLSEIAIGLKLGRPVILLDSWSAIDAAVTAESAAEAVETAFELLSRNRSDHAR